MSFIHCSPLFYPLEPLPVMSPTVMRSCAKKNSSKASTNSSGSISSSKSNSTTSASATTRVKRVAATRRASHPLAETPITMPDDHPLPAGLSTAHSLPNDLSSVVGATSAATSQVLPPTSSYQDSSFVSTSAPMSQATQLASFYEDSFDSQMQGSLTFTVESQPMGDLSSSQQKDT